MAWLFSNSVRATLMLRATLLLLPTELLFPADFLKLGGVEALWTQKASSRQIRVNERRDGARFPGPNPTSLQQILKPALSAVK